MPESEARRVATNAAKLQQVGPGAWRPPQPVGGHRYPLAADRAIVQHCGHSVATKGSALANALSPLRAYWPVQYPENGPDPGYGQVTVTAYADEVSAESAVRSPRESGFASCVIAAIKEWFPAAGYDLSQRESYLPLKSSSIRTAQKTITDNGASLRLISGQFDEELLGGSDNTHDIAEVRGRSGPVVVTAYYATNSQGGDPARTKAVAERQAVAALDRVRSELKD